MPEHTIHESGIEMIDYRNELKKLLIAYRTGKLTKVEYHSYALPIRAALNALHTKGERA